MHGNPEMGLWGEPKEKVRQEQLIVRNTKGCFRVQGQTGGSREGSLEEVW